MEACIHLVPMPHGTVIISQSVWISLLKKNPTVKNPYKKLLQKNWLMTLLAALLVFLMVLFMKEAWEVF